MFSASGDENKFALPSEQLCRRFSLAEIQSATQNFEDSLVIGQGGFGKVYKGQINIGTSDAAAIKRLDSTSKQGASEFWTEIEMLSRLRHCHLVSLIGYCNDGDEMILVYDYMAGGTLDYHLHKVRTPMSWVQRLKICIGAARGLDYLHTGTGTQDGVIHRDVKTSNILLDENWAPKISDFGLSKKGPVNQPSTYVNTDVKGTFGYLDPQYYLTGKLTRKSDVYAFGVVMLEVLCRRPAVDVSLDEEQWALTRWASHCTKKGKLNQIIDFSLREHVLPKYLMEYAQIAHSCLHDCRKQRPTMAEVIVKLEFALSVHERMDSLGTKRTLMGKVLSVLSTKANSKSVESGERSVHSSVNEVGVEAESGEKVAHLPVRSMGTEVAPGEKLGCMPVGMMRTEVEVGSEVGRKSFRLIRAFVFTPRFEISFHVACPNKSQVLI